MKLGKPYSKIADILENNQVEDGVIVPEILRPFMPEGENIQFSSVVLRPS
jgi:seryl-tRNA synthetase